MLTPLLSAGSEYWAVVRTRAARLLLDSV